MGIQLETPKVRPEKAAETARCLVMSNQIKKAAMCAIVAASTIAVSIASVSGEIDGMDLRMSQMQYAAPAATMIIRSTVMSLCAAMISSAGIIFG